MARFSSLFRPSAVAAVAAHRTARGLARSARSFIGRLAKGVAVTKARLSLVFLPMLVLLLAARLTAAPASAADPPAFQSLWYGAGATSNAPCRSMGVLVQPSGWSSGDAAVVMMNSASPADSTRDWLVAALLLEGAAVMEIVSGAAIQCDDANRAVSQRALPRDPVAELLGALDAVTITGGAGVVVAIGYDAEGQAALAAAREDAATRWLGTNGSRFAAAIALGGSAPGFARGTPPHPSEGWDGRAARLCATVAAAMPDRQFHLDGEVTAASCLDALLMPRAAATVRSVQLRHRDR